MTDARFPMIRRSAAVGLLIILVTLVGMPTFTFSAPGNLDTSFNPNITGGIQNVFATVVQPDGKIPIGGSFSSVGVTARNNIARLNSTGSAETSAFNPGTGADSTVYCVAVQPDGKILIGGYFGSVNGQPNTNRIARLDTNGSVDPTFNAGTGPSDLVHCMAVQPDGKIVIGGLFTTVDGQPRNRIARLNANGSLESTDSFNPGSGADDSVYSIAVQSDGQILVGGNFTSVNGQSRIRIARLNGNGSVEDLSTFNPGSGANNRVYCIALQPDGKILLGGNFTIVNGQSRVRIVRLNSGGTVEDISTFNPGIGADYPVFSTALQADGKIVLGGGFLTVGGASRSGVARLNANGNVESPLTFNSGTGADWDVNGVAIQADGKILLVGGFNSFNGTTRNLMARLLNDTVGQSVDVVNAAQVQWLRGGAAPEVSQVTFELSTNGESTWSPLGNGIRIAGGWQFTGLSLPASGIIRARGRTIGGYYNGSSGIVEQKQVFAIAPPPTVSTIAASSVTGITAVLNGSVNANGASSTVTFEYGTTISHGNSVTATPSPITGSTATSVSAMVTGLTTGTIYHYKAKGINNGGTGDGGDVTFTTLTAVDHWRQTYFGSPANSGPGADTATPDHDGIPNLLKYALVITPGASGVNSMPIGQRRSYAEGDRLALIFTRDPAHNDISLYVEAANNPAGPWTEVIASSVNGADMTGSGVVSEITASGGLKTVEVRDTISISNAPRRFLRIRVVH